MLHDAGAHQQLHLPARGEIAIGVHVQVVEAGQDPLAAEIDDLRLERRWRLAPDAWDLPAINQDRVSRRRPGRANPNPFGRGKDVAGPQPENEAAVGFGVASEFQQLVGADRQIEQESTRNQLRASSGILQDFVKRGGRFLAPPS